MSLLYDTNQRPTASPKVSIEVIMEAMLPNELHVRVDETEPVKYISRHGVKIISYDDRVAVIEMTEKRALDYDLL